MYPHHIKGRFCVQLSPCVYSYSSSKASMGFDWSINVSVSYAQPVTMLNCYSRFATRCLQFRDDNARDNDSLEPSPKRTKRSQLN